MTQPTPFFDVKVNRLDLDPMLIGLCVGYEFGEWRYDALVDHLMEWMPEFCLTAKECSDINAGNMVPLMREAAKKLYTSQKFTNRGEFGELILHAALRQIFGSIPAISKIYFKSASNDTVKGFDAVHIVPNDDDIELWLGEVKFYKDLNAAIRDVVVELHEHLEKNYLRDEFMLIGGKVEDELPFASQLRRLLDPNVSLDQVFNRLVIPVLLTYESSTVESFDKVSDEYTEKFKEEIHSGYEKFVKKALPGNVQINLFLVPLESKENLINKLDEKLRVWQSI